MYCLTMERMKSQYDIVCIQVLTCMTDMCKNLSVLRGHTSNKAKARFAFGNPMVTMMCAIHSYYLFPTLQLTCFIYTTYYQVMISMLQTSRRWFKCMYIKANCSQNIRNIYSGQKISGKY